jgi:hypothetical protein
VSSKSFPSTANHQPDQKAIFKEWVRARGMVPEKVTSALDLLEYHVESQRMFGKTVVFY